MAGLGEGSRQRSGKGEMGLRWEDLGLPGWAGLLQAEAGKSGRGSELLN